MPVLTDCLENLLPDRFWACQADRQAEAACALSQAQPSPGAYRTQTDASAGAFIVKFMLESAVYA